MKKLILGFSLFIDVISGNVWSTRQENELVVPDPIITKAALKTLSKNSKVADSTLTELENRKALIKSFLISVGGNEWYSNYQKRFGAPTEPELSLIAMLHGFSDKRLREYYVYRPPISREQMTVISCAKKKQSITMNAWCALNNWNAALLLKDSKSLADFQYWAKWFLDNQKDGRWEWLQDVLELDVKAPWISGLTQSLGISILLRQYQQTNDAVYLDVARSALAWIKKPVSEGGISVKTQHGTWYEEYPSINNPSHVLNGHLWALFGIWDYYRATGDKAAKKMFDEGISILKRDIHKYDVSDWSVYSQANSLDLVTGEYQNFIVLQLLVLHKITGECMFQKYAKKWGDSQKNETLFINLLVNEFIKANPDINLK
jgi:hypothetical protein